MSVIFFGVVLLIAFAGALVTGAADHFGLFGAMRFPVDAKRPTESR